MEAVVPHKWTPWATAGLESLGELWMSPNWRKLAWLQRKRKGSLIQKNTSAIFVAMFNEKIQLQMKNARTFLTALSASMLLMSCGNGTESTGAASASLDQDACSCLVEMNASLTELMSAEQSSDWTVQDWTQALTENTSACMLVERTPEELNAWSKAQLACDEFAAYTTLVGQFREQLIAVREATREMPTNMNEITDGGAKGLLDQLSKGNQ